MSVEGGDSCERPDFDGRRCLVLRIHKRSVAVAAVLFTALLAGTASAQSPGFAIDRFDPAERGSDWFVAESMDFRGHLRPAGGLVAEWARKPLVTYTPDGSERTALVSDQLFLHAGGALIAWDRVRFALNIPLAVYQAGNDAVASGASFRAPSSASFGDIRIGVDALAFGRYRAPVSFGGGIQLYVPSGDRDAFTGDGKVRIVPRALVAGAVGPF